ncbi:MAG: LysM peptidoglycan-binding domain-containing protein [Desulfobacteraceae bacterium]|jgi:LysM repeat protein
MEVVTDTKMKLHMQTDKRTLEKEFSNLHDLRLFMENFFSSSGVVDRRSEKSAFEYPGPERRMRSSNAEMSDAQLGLAEDPAQIQETKKNVKQSRPESSRSDRRFLIYGGMAIFILIVVSTFLVKAHDKVLEKDLDALKQRAVTLEEKFPRLAGELTRLESFISKFDGSLTSLTSRLDALSQNIDRMAKKMALTAIDIKTSMSPHEKPTSRTKSRYHEVRPGETLFRIAKRYGINVDELCSLNHITPKTVIHPGQKLLVTFASS